jgi:hypothetical protein
MVETGHFIYFYFKKLNFSKALHLFLQKYKRSGTLFLQLLRVEILQFLPIYKFLKKTLKRKRHHHLFPLKDEVIEEVKNIEASLNTDYKTTFIKSVNAGELGSDVSGLSKHASAFELQFLSPLISKEVNELFIQIPEEYFLLNGNKRSFIKECMKNLVPKEILNRTDKKPFSPDYNKRIANINIAYLESLKPYGGNKTEYLGVNYASLRQLISNLNSLNPITTWEVNGELFYIPFAIIAIEFHIWLNKKL